jgi:type IV pilus assembly protein PilY1
MRTFRKPTRFNRALAAALAFFVGLGPVATPAYAALTSLSDEPLSVKNASKPNIVLTIDDSTSMLYDFLPDYVVGTVAYVGSTKTVTDTFCRGQLGSMSVACGYNDFPTNAGDGGQYVSPQYIWEQPTYTDAAGTLHPALPYRAYNTGTDAGIAAPFSAPFQFNNSGPGAGCNTLSAPPSCSDGVDPGTEPGINVYPLTAGTPGASPMAGQPYEYWLLWPAPAHNSALNHLYYNPLLTYAPPVYSDGSSFPDMTSDVTSGWTKVPPNPFINTDNVFACVDDGSCVDLTAKVIVGQWCNSDWTQGNDDSGTAFVTNPTFCRNNGLIAAAADGVAAADGDYEYPWTPAPGTHTTGATPLDLASITPNGWGLASDWKVDWSTVSITTGSVANAAVRPVWSSAADGAAPRSSQYFYENDNVLWCDITSPDWPQTGPTIPQTCGGYVGSQICNATSTPVCSGGVSGVCSGYVPAGTCTGYMATGTCSGGAPNGKCTGYVAGKCTGFVTGKCAAVVAAKCNNIPTCSGGAAAACSGQTHEACSGVTGVCGAAPSQTCNGGTHTACQSSGTTFDCNGYKGPQTCDNHTPAPTCPFAWDPPGCNINPDPEGTCVYHQVCNNPAPVYTCSISGASCLNAAGTGGDSSKCPIIYGSCSGGTNAGGQCSTNSNCPGTTNKCASGGAACTTDNDCPFNSNSGTCSIEGQPCTPGGSACPAGKQHCSAGLPSTTVCTTSTQCNVSGKCAITTATSCTTSANCPIVANSGKCNYQNNAGVAAGACTANTDCKAKPNACSAPAGQACTTINDCTPGTCTYPVGQSCTTNGGCTATPSTCTTGNVGAACGANADCNVLGKCTQGQPNTTTCTVAADCNVNGACTTGNVGAVCTTTSSTDTACKKAGACTTGNIGATCFTNAAGDAACLKNGTCSNNGAISCTTDAVCVATNGKCSAGQPSTTSCTTNANCNVSNICSQSANNGATCTTTADCTANGACSIDGKTCTKNADCASVGKCSITGATCFKDGDCPNQPGPLNPALAACDTTGVSGNALTTLLADANGAGKTCRHNNHTYADGAADRYTYPSGKFTTPVHGENVAGMGCHRTDQYTEVPRHYWKTAVEWCHDQVNTAGDKWLGYGTGDCQGSRDSSHLYPRFHQFATLGGTDNYDTPAFQRANLVNDGTDNEFTHNSIDDDGNPQTPVVRNYAQEMQNYANWFAYYRTRIQAIKTVTSLSFLGKDPTTSKFNVDDSFRVGLHTLSNSPATTFVPVDDFGDTQKASWATQLFGLNVKMAQETPTLNAIVRIGEYYKNGTSDELSVSADPIVLSCQKNWHMLFTDGVTNQPTLPTITVGDTDNKTPDGSWLTDAVPPLTPNTDWAHPYQENTAAPISNSSADYSTYYWANDLRPSMTNNVGHSAVDPATWQHVNFAAISLGTAGKLAAGDQQNVEKQLTSGALEWPTPGPSVNKPDASGVDDLWHASVNARGEFVNADSADEVKIGIGSILKDIENSAGSRAGAGLQTVNFVGPTQYAYQVSFEPGWGGTLSKVQIDSTTFDSSGVVQWKVGGGAKAPPDQLYNQLTPTPDNPDPWYTSRNIVTTHTNGSAIPFRFDSLSASEQDALAPGNADAGLKVLAYLRGDSTNEGTGTLQFRVRSSPLGDIVDASPRYLGKPNAPYQDFADPGYSTFKTTYQSRPAVVYAAANDGMLHAFADETDGERAAGTEMMAYVPRELFRPSEDAGLAALTLKEGALPPFEHHFYVDSTPKVVDVNFGASDSDWHSVLVGGLGKGGHSYYALDVTDMSSVAAESDAVNHVLWEFTDTDMGYTYGPPVVTKTAGFGGKWVAIFPSGYNNPSGVGKIYIVDIKTGELLKTMSTGSGTADSPSGLAQIAGFTQDYHNYMTDEIYGGDQYGNVWRFDLRDPDPDNWKVGLLAKLTAPDGTVQPVTTAPQIEIDIANGADRWVFIGTGRLLDVPDLSNPQIQSFYALRDGTQKTPSAIVTGSPIARDQLQSVTSGAGTGSITAHGWYIDLAQFSQVVSPYQAVLSIVVFSATRPQTDPCLTGQSADVYVRSFAEGVSQVDATDSNTGAGIICDSNFCSSAGGAVDAEIIGTTSDGSPTANLSVGITLGTTGQLVKIPIKQPTWSYTHRLSWRILSE